MSNRITVNYNKKPCYDIVIENNFDGLPDEMKALGCSDRRVCLVVDSNVSPIYADQVKGLLGGVCKSIHVFEFPAGEKSKTLDTVQQLYRYLIEENFDRKDLLAALGGGVTGDLTGYAAATYLRGVDFVQIPTTLLAQLDSSIGGKTGVDFDSYKNMIGAFHMPLMIYMNLDTLQTLDSRQFFNGFAEVMKHGLIRDVSFYEWQISNMYEICERDPAVLEEMVSGSCEIKRAVVEKDPAEKGERMLLNFGHTIGHAIEKALNFEMLHGECVALGCVAAAYISWKRDLLTMEEYYEIRDMFVPFYLPISVEGIDPLQILKLTKADKKMDNGQITFILLKKAGKAVVVKDVTDEEILAAVNEIHYSDEDSHE